jgi:DNA-binding transcriptional LysR family regulator
VVLLHGQLASTRFAEDNGASVGYNVCPHRTMLRPQHLPLLAVFAQICRDGSFTAAAHSLGLSKSVVSSHLSNLEAVLEVRLFERSTRRISLTQAGEQVLAAAGRMLDAADDVNLVGQTQRNRRAASE